MSNKDYYENLFNTNDGSFNDWDIDYSKKFLYKTYKEEEYENNNNFVVKTSDLNDKMIEVFSEYENEKNNTKIVEVLDKEEVELDLEEKHAVVILDESGSVTWNDNKNDRYDLISNALSKINNSYPSNVYYDLYRYGGKNINIYNLPYFSNSLSIDGKELEEIFGNSKYDYYGTRIVRKEDSFPSNPNDGIIVFDGVAESITDENLDINEDYYYSIFTYNKNKKFSTGRNIKFNTTDYNSVSQISSVDYKVLIGTGIRKDESLDSVWHFGEATGSISYDFSNKIDISGDLYWINKEESPIGNGAIRVKGNNDLIKTNLTDKYNIDSEKSFIFWLRPFSIKEQILFSSEDDASVNYIVKMTSDGRIGISFDGVSYDSSNIIFDSSRENVWSYVGITINNNDIKIYIDGVLEDSFSSSVVSNLDEYNFKLGYSDNDTNDFLGLITEFSIHNIERDIDYISDNYIVSEDVLDNGDRLAIINVGISDESSNNIDNVKVYKSFNNIKYPDENYLFLDKNVNEDFYFTDTNVYPLISVKYNIFSSYNNTIIKSSLSKKLEINISKIKNNNDGIGSHIDNSLPLPNVSILEGNDKISLEWDYDNNLDIVGIIGVMSSTGYVSIDDLENLSENENVILKNFDTSITNFVYISKTSINDVRQYLSFVYIDKYGRMSNESNYSVMPGVNDNDIPVKNVDIKNVYENGNGSIKIEWDNPVPNNKELNGFLGDDIIVYTILYDEDGNKIDIQNSELIFNVSGEVSSKIEEDVFDNTESDLKFEDIYEVIHSDYQDGIITTNINQLLSNDSLANIDNVDISFELKISFVDNESYKNGKFEKNIIEIFSKKVLINLVNPLKSSVENKHNYFIEKTSDVEENFDICEGVSIDLFNGNSSSKIDGLFASVDDNFVARFLASFKNSVISEGVPVRYELWSADLIENDGVFLFSKKEKINEDIFLNENFSFSHEEVEEKDFSGKNTGISNRISFVDFEIKTPNKDGSYILFVKLNYGGFSTINSIGILYENPLSLKIFENPPKPDGLDVKEQKAKVTIYNNGGFVPVEDGTKVNWSIKNLTNGKKRPFYSKELNNDNSIKSSTENGMASDIFWGPISDVDITKIKCNQIDKILGEVYELSASVSYKGFSREIKKDIHIAPEKLKDVGVPRIYMELENIEQKITSDGKDYIKATVYRNPNISDGVFQACFEECSLDFGEDLLELNIGQEVEVFGKSGNNGILTFYYDDITEVIEDGIETISIGENTLTGTDSLIFPLKYDENIIYITLNGFYPKIEEDVTTLSQALNSIEKYINPCECLKIKETSDDANNFYIQSFTDVNIDNNEIKIYGGGDYEDGLPPTTITPVEPLKLEYSHIEVDDNEAKSIVLGKVNKVYVKADFAGRQIPNGIPISISSTLVDEENIFIKNEIISYIDNEEKSYAYFEIFLDKEKNIDEIINLSIEYDESGDIDRKIDICFKLHIDINNKDIDTEEQNIENMFSGKIYLYDIGSESWNYDFAKMQYPRVYVNSFIYNDNIYIINGLDNKSITNINEKYNISLDEWSLLSECPKKLMSSQSILVGDYFYIFGGIIEEDRVLKASNKAYRYDIINDEWNELDNMENSVVFGGIQYVSSNNEIVIFSGCNKINSDLSPSVYNDRLQIFNLNTNTWESSLKIDEPSYRRIFPESFIKNNNVYIIGGVRSESDNVIFINESVKIDNSYVLTKVDSLYPELPINKYKSSFVHFNDKFYIIGGSNLKSDFSKTFEELNISDEDSFEYTEKNNIENPTSGSVLLSDNINSNDSLVLIEGFSTGRKNGFVKIQLDKTIDEVNLNGEEISSYKISLLDGANEIINEDIDIKLLGRIKFPEKNKEENSIELRDVVYPVIYNERIKTVNGEAYVYIRGRSDDVLLNSEDIIDKNKDLFYENEISSKDEQKVIMIDGLKNEPYVISTEIEIIDDFYFGKTIDDISIILTEEEKNIVEDTKKDAKEDGDNDKCFNLSVSNSWIKPFVSLKDLGIKKLFKEESRRDATSKEGFGLPVSNGFSVIPQFLEQSFNPISKYYNDKIWVPFFDRVLSKVPYGTINSFINNIDETVGYGGSNLYDVLYEVSKRLETEDFNEIDKLIYLFSDNEAKYGKITLDNVIENIKSIENNIDVPVVAVNTALVAPETLSTKKTTSDTYNVNKLSKETGGQSFSFVDSSDIEGMSKNIIGKLKGSFGYGEFSYIYDFEEIVNLKTIVSLFEINDGNSGFWKVSYGNSLKELKSIRTKFNSSDTYNIDKKLRYVKIDIILTADLRDSIEFPKFLGNSFTYYKNNEKVLIVKDNLIDYSQLFLHINTNENCDVTYSLGDNEIFDSFEKSKNNSIFINPVRNSDYYNEKLIRISPLEYKFENGKINKTDDVVVFSSNLEEIEESFIINKTFDGIIFYEPNEEAYFVKINRNYHHLNVLIKNDTQQDIEFDNISYMYANDVRNNKNVILDPIPFSIKIVKGSPVDKISVKYSFIDHQDLNEDFSNRLIKWYINGRYETLLDNYVEWNNLSDESDPIIKYYGGLININEKIDSNSLFVKNNDIIFCEISVSNGVKNSKLIRSNSVKIDTLLPSIGIYSIYGEYDDGKKTSSPTSDVDIKINFEQSTNSDNTKIIWYVNGEKFKEVKYSDTDSLILKRKEVNNNGILGISYGNEIYADIFPIDKDGKIGEKVSTNSLFIENVIPEIDNFSMTPEKPLSGNKLEIYFDILDTDIDLGSSQTNQTEIRWYKKESSNYIENISLRDATVLNSSLMNRNDEWKLEIKPFDGIDYGETKVLEFKVL